MSNRPYDNVEQARRHHRRVRLDTLRMMCTTSRINGSAFALLYISPAGEAETYSSTSLRPHLKNWFTPQVRKQAADSVSRYFRTRRAIEANFALPNDFRGRFEESAFAIRQAAREDTKRRARSRKISGPHSKLDDDWEDEEMQGNRRHADSDDEGSIIIHDPTSPAEQSSVNAEAGPSTNLLKTPGRVAQNKSIESPQVSMNGTATRSPSLSAQPSRSREADATMAMNGAPTPPLSNSPAENNLRSPKSRSSSTLPPAQLLLPMTFNSRTIDEWYTSVFANMPYDQQSDLCQIWIRVQEPDHKAQFPYNKRDGTKPSWWPSEVPHLPPGRLLEPDRPVLLTALIRSRRYPVSVFEDKTTEESYAISLELDYLLTDIYKVARLEREVWATSPQDPVFTVPVLPLDSPVLRWTSDGSAPYSPPHQEPEPRPKPVKPATNVLASPMKPLESNTAHCTISSQPASSRHRSRRSLSSQPSASEGVIPGVSPALRARTMAQPYSLQRSNSTSSVMPTISSSSRPLSRSHSMTGGSLDEAMASKDRGIASAKSRRHRKSVQLDQSTLAYINSPSSIRQGDSSTALQRALDSSQSRIAVLDDSHVKSPTGAATNLKRPNQSPGAASFSREPTFASPAMIKSSSRLSFLGAPIESIPEAVDASEGSPSRTAAKKATGSTSLSRQGSRVSASKKERAPKVAAPKPIKIHPSHQFQGYSTEQGGVYDTDYPTPTYPQKIQPQSYAPAALQYESYDQARSQSDQSHPSRPPSAAVEHQHHQQHPQQQYPHQAHAQRHPQQQEGLHSREQQDQVIMHYHDQQQQQHIPPAGHVPRVHQPASTHFVIQVPGPDVQQQYLPQHYANQQYPIEHCEAPARSEDNHQDFVHPQQQHQPEIRYLPTPDAQRFDPYASQNYPPTYPREQADSNDCDEYVLQSYQSPDLALNDHSHNIGYHLAAGDRQSYPSETPPSYPNELIGPYTNDASTFDANVYAQWAASQPGQDQNVAMVDAGWEQQNPVYDERGMPVAPLHHHDTLRYESVAYGV